MGKRMFDAGEHAWPEEAPFLNDALIDGFSIAQSPIGCVTVRRSYDPRVAQAPFVPPGFKPPTSLVAERFHLEPLGPQHNAADHAAWMSSIQHIRGTPGYLDRDWPPLDGMSVEANLADLRRHAADFDSRAGFTFTVLDSTDGDVIGCVYLYPSGSDEYDVSVRSWVRADRSGLDGPVATAVGAWIASEWPWQHPDRHGR